MKQYAITKSMYHDNWNINLLWGDWCYLTKLWWLKFKSQSHVKQRTTSPQTLLLYGITLRVCSVTQSCPTICGPTDWSLPSSSVHGSFQARILDWVAITNFRESSWPQGPNLYLLCLLHCRWILYLPSH